MERNKNNTSVAVNEDEFPLEAYYPKFTSEHNNLMSKLLTPKIYSELRNKLTPKGFTLDQAIQTGVDNPGHPYIKTVGMVAGDEESYKIFAKLFDLVIKARHGYNQTDKHKTDLNPKKLKVRDFDYEDKYIISSRIRSARSIRGFRLPPACTRAERREIERIISKALVSLHGDLKGNYYPLDQMTSDLCDKLRTDHLLFQKPDSPLLISSGSVRDWPDARGVFLNSAQNFIVWINEEDHMRIISMQKGSNVGEVFDRFCRGVSSVEKAINGMGFEFMYNDHLGYIVTCPSNLGTGLRASVLLKIPNLINHPEFKDICEKLNLQARGSGGENSDLESGICDLSNHARLGYSEVELVEIMVNGVKKIIEMEKMLE
ncbi:MAG: arginine kinase [Proteobacteria bacterium]|nr:MAG: arginine kinase [Pseudomonadota bacterium]